MSGKIGNIGSKSGVVGGNIDVAPVKATYFQAYSQLNPTIGGTREFLWHDGGTVREFSNFTWSDSSDQHKIFPNTNGFYWVYYGVRFVNEPPAGAEADAGVITLMVNGSGIQSVAMSFIVSDANTYHESQLWSMSKVVEITNGTGSNDYFSLQYDTNWTLGNYNEGVDIVITKLSSSTG